MALNWTSRDAEVSMFMLKIVPSLLVHSPVSDL